MMFAAWPKPPDVPFCAAARTATVVVLSRRSAPERVRPAAPTTPAAERGSACCSAGAGGLPRLLLLLPPTGTCGSGDFRNGRYLPPNLDGGTGTRPRCDWDLGG